MAETTNANPQIGFARETKGSTTRNLQLGREERQQVGAAANRKQKNRDFMMGEQELKRKEQRQKIGQDLLHEGERVYSQEEVRNLPERPLAAMFKEDDEMPKVNFASGQKRRRRRNRGGRGKAGDSGALRPSEQAPRTHEKELIENELNLEWIPQEPEFNLQARKKGRGKPAKANINATPSQPTPAKKLSIKGEDQVLGQTGSLQTGGGMMQQGGEGGAKRKRNRRRNRGKKMGGGEQTLGDQVAQKGGDLAQKASNVMEGQGGNIAQKGKDWSEAAGDFVDRNLPESLQSKEGSWGEKLAETGKGLAEKAGNMMEGGKSSDLSGDKQRGKMSERYINEEVPKRERGATKEATEKMEDYTPIEAVKSLAGDIVEQTGNKLADIKDATLSTLGFDTSSETKEDRIESEQKDVKEDFVPEKAEGEGILESAKDMLSHAFEAVKENVSSAVEYVSEAATDMGLTLEPGLAPDTYPKNEQQMYVEPKMSKEKLNDNIGEDNRLDSALDKMESVQPI